MYGRYQRRHLLRLSASTAVSFAGFALLVACGQSGAATTGTTSAVPTTASALATAAPAAAPTTPSQSANSVSASFTTGSASAPSLATPTAPASAASSTTATRVSGQPIPLEYLMDGWSDAENKLMQDSLVADFEQKNPQYKLTMIFSAGSTTASQKYTTMVAGGTPPDLVYLTFPHFTFAAAGQLLDFTPYAAKDKAVNWDADYYPRVTGYYKIPAPGFWALPHNYATEVLFYNTAVFQQAGRPLPDANYTYDQQVADAQALVQRSGSDTTRWGITVRLSRIDQILWAYGGAFIDDQATKSHITEPGAVTALQYIGDLINKWKVMPSKGNALQLFQQGQLALNYDPEWAVPMFNKVNDLGYDVALMPKGPAGQFTFFFPGGVAGSKASKNPDGTYALGRWFVYDDVPVDALIVNSPFGESPTAKIARNEYYWNQKLTKPSHRGVFLNSPNIGKVPFFLQPHGEQLTDPVFKGLQPLWDRTATAEQVSQQLDPVINTILKQPLKLQNT